MSNRAPRLEPAHSIILAFGEGNLTKGIEVVANVTRRHPSRVLRWMYPKSKGGTGGAIPTGLPPVLLKSASELNVPVGPEHFFETGSVA